MSVISRTGNRRGPALTQSKSQRMWESIPSPLTTSPPPTHHHHHLALLTNGVHLLPEVVHCLVSLEAQARDLPEVPVQVVSVLAPHLPPDVAERELFHLLALQPAPYSHHAPCTPARLSPLSLCSLYLCRACKLPPHWTTSLLPNTPPLQHPSHQKHRCKL